MFCLLDVQCARERAAEHATNGGGGPVIWPKALITLPPGSHFLGLSYYPVRVQSGIPYGDFLACSHCLVSTSRLTCEPGDQRATKDHYEMA